MTALSRAETSKRFIALRERPRNAHCAECRAADTSWVVLDYGVLICVRCAGAHRGLGTHISKVRSTQHDSFTSAELDWIESQGNAKSADLYEGALPPTMRRPEPSACPDVVRRIWLRLKYDELRFTAGLATSRLAPHESLTGWLQVKEPGTLQVLASWRRRFARVRGGALLLVYADEAEDDESLRAALPLAGADVHVEPNEPLVLRLRTNPHQAKVNGGSSDGHGRRTLLLRAPTHDEAEGWAWALYQCAHGAAQRAEREPELLVLPRPKAKRRSWRGGSISRRTSVAPRQQVHVVQVAAPGPAPAHEVEREPQEPVALT